MNFNLLLLVYSLFIVSPLKSGSYKTVCITHQIPEVLNGKVKRLIENRKEHGGGEEQICPHDTTTFNIKGISIKTNLGIGYRKCGATLYISKYDANGKLIKIYKQRPSNGGITYKFNSSGYVSEILNELFKTKYIYNTKNRLIKSIDYSTDENKTFRLALSQKYIYDSKSHLVEVDFYNKKDILRQKTFYNFLSFDKKGNWTKRVTKAWPNTLEIDTTEHILEYY